MAKAVQETATSADAHVEGQRQAKTAKEQCTENFRVQSSRVTCGKQWNGTPAKGPLWDNANALSFMSKDGHNASVWNTFSTVLETCCCQPRWTHGSSTGVAWT